MPQHSIYLCVYCLDSVGSCRFNYITFERLLLLNLPRYPRIPRYLQRCHDLYIFLYRFSIAEFTTNLSDTFRKKKNEKPLSLNHQRRRKLLVLSKSNLVAIWNGGSNLSYRWILNEDQPDSSKSRKRRKLITKFFLLVSLFTYSFTGISSQWLHQIIIKHNPYHLRGKLSVSAATSPHLESYYLISVFGLVLCERVRLLFNDHLMAFRLCRVARQGETPANRREKKIFHESCDTLAGGYDSHSGSSLNICDAIFATYLCAASVTRIKYKCFRLYFPGDLYADNDVCCGWQKPIVSEYSDSNTSHEPGHQHTKNDSDE